MVLLLEGKVLREQGLNLVGVVVRAETSLRCAQVVDTRSDPHVRQRRRGHDGVVDQLEECGLLLGGDRVGQASCSRIEGL